MSALDQTLERLISLADRLATAGYEPNYDQKDGEEARQARIDLEALQEAILIVRSEQKARDRTVVVHKAPAMGKTEVAMLELTRALGEARPWDSAQAEADMARARLGLVMAMGALHTALGDTEADLKKPERGRVLRRRIDEIAATIKALDR